MNNSMGNVSCSHMFVGIIPPSWMNGIWPVMSLLLVGESVLTVYVIRRCPRMRRKTSTKLIINLAISGGLCGCLVTLLTIATLTNSMREATVWCIIILPRYFHIVSILCLSCLALDRYLAICWPLRYNNLLTDSRCKVLVLGCWLVPVIALVILLPSTKFFFNCYHPSPFLTTYLVVFTMASLMVMLMYVLMAQEFRMSRHEVGHAAKAMEEDNRRVRVKTARDVLVIVFLHLLLALPDVIVNLLRVLKVIEWDYTYVFAPLLMLLHEMVCLPLIAWRNADFRATLYASCCRRRLCTRDAAHATRDSDLSKNIPLVTRESQFSNNIAQFTQDSELSKDISLVTQESQLSNNIAQITQDSEL